MASMGDMWAQLYGYQSIQLILACGSQ